MIRYVLVVLLAVTVLGMTATALDHATAARSEQSIEADIERIDDAATALIEHEAPTRAAPRRIVEIELPTESVTSAGADRFVFEPVPETGVTRVRYSVDGRTEKQVTLGTVLGRPGGGSVDMSHWRGTHRLRLTLKPGESGDRYVAMTDATGDEI